MARIERLRIYPVKGLDGVEPDEARLREGGTLAGDREFALVDPDGGLFNGKQTDRLARIDADFDPATGRLSVLGPDGDASEFDLETAAGRERAGSWFDDRLEADVELRRDRSVGFLDRPEMGPSVISTATLRTVAGWFEELDVDGVRRRLRANVEVGGVEPFWEDRFVGDDAPAFEAGGVRFEGATPCARCVVPQRDPDTGEPLPGFRERFLEKRRETFPEWADETAFDHYYTLMLIARVPDPDPDASLRVEDPVRTLA